MYRRYLRRRCGFSGFSGFSGRISEGCFATAIGDLEAIDLDRFPTLPLMRRAYGLRAKPPYDATYVALAELLGCELLTGDQRLACYPDRDQQDLGRSDAGRSPGAHALRGALPDALSGPS
jgi:hypothetical protein